MGQYYKAIILNPNARKRHSSNKHKIVASFSSYDYGNGAKLMEHSYIDNDFVSAVEKYLEKNTDQPVEGYPLVWAGDYADEESWRMKGQWFNLYTMARDLVDKDIKFDEKFKSHRYIINETLKVFIDLSKIKEDKYGYRIHPLPILCSEGNGRGGGDYHAENQPKEIQKAVGSWARNFISVSDIKPLSLHYTEVEFGFYEEW